jgi:conjugal transfer pilus assembly protein TraF
MESFLKRIRSGSTLLLLLAALTVCPAGISATAAEPKEGPPEKYYYNPPKEGWYWYHDPKLDEPEDRRAPEVQKSKREPEVGQKYAKDELYDMYPDRFQDLLKERLKTAVQFPTEENVEDYLTMQDIARRKAAAFTSAVQYVTQKNAATFSVNDVYPGTTPGMEARIQMQQQEIEGTIGGARNDHAILFFWKPGCGFCEKQVGILKYFSEKYGWEIKPINIAEQKDFAARFNITTTPTLLLIRQGNEQYMPISVGVISLAEMEQKLYQAIRYLNGNTDIDTFTNTDFEKGGTLDPRAILQKNKGGTL